MANAAAPAAAALAFAVAMAVGFHAVVAVMFAVAGWQCVAAQRPAMAMA